MADHIYTYVNPVRIKDIESVCQALHGDKVLAVAMDVAWSFVCDAASSKALDRIHQLKPAHPKTRPFSLVCDSIAMASHIVTIDNIVYPWLKKALPGPFTVLLERHSSLPKQIHDKRREVGLRVPKCELVLALIKAYGKPLAASTVPPILGVGGDSELPKFGWEVAEAFGSRIDVILDLGEESPRLETTIIDLTKGAPALVRSGAGEGWVFGLI
ncbi:MAG: L-threonylcarbamoyladenylate synthase [Proteobacteria bacterium]|nr:L-threonylcarbamoyladenylate synthase [Pseudomonadota bacterium]